VRESGHHPSGLVALAALIAAAGATARAQERVQGHDVAQACIYRPNIDHTRVLDDRTILFFMRGREIYQNTLTDQCYSLKSANRFAYGEASLHRVCTGNLISVIHDIAPGRISQSNSCKLGAFVPVDQDVADELIAAAEPSGKNKAGDKRRTVQVVPVESPPESSQPATNDAPPSPSPPAEATPQLATTPTAEPKSTVEPKPATEPTRSAESAP